MLQLWPSEKEVRVSKKSKQRMVLFCKLNVEKVYENEFLKRSGDPNTRLVSFFGVHMKCRINAMVVMVENRQMAVTSTKF